MARNSPVITCKTRHRPSIDPKFHQIEILLGAGRSIIELFMIFTKGWDLRRGWYIGREGA
jgi:hypothetical protein